MKHKRQVLAKPEDGSEKKGSGEIKRRKEDSTNNNMNPKSSPSSPDSMCSSDVKKEESNDGFNRGSSSTPNLLSNGAILPLTGPGSLGVPGVLNTPPNSVPNTGLEAVKVKAEDGSLRLTQMSGAFAIETGSLKENMSPRPSPVPLAPATSSPDPSNSPSTPPISSRSDIRGPISSAVSSTPQPFISVTNARGIGRGGSLPNTVSSYSPIESLTGNRVGYSSSTTNNFRNSWGSADQKWGNRGTPPQYMSANSPRHGTPLSYDYSSIQHHQQSHHQQQQPQHQQSSQQNQRGSNSQQQGYNNGFYAMDSYNYNRQYYNNNMMCSDGYSYSYNNGMYCPNMYNGCPEAQQYYDPQQYALAQGFDPEKAGMVSANLSQNGTIPNQNLIPSAMTNYYNCAANGGQNPCPQDAVGYHEYQGSIPPGHEPDINFSSFNFFEQTGNGGGQTAGVLLGPSSGPPDPISNPGPGPPSNIGSARVGGTVAGVPGSLNCGTVGQACPTGTVPNNVNTVTNGPSMTGGNSSVLSGGNTGVMSGGNSGGITGGNTNVISGGNGGVITVGNGGGLIAGGNSGIISGGNSSVLSGGNSSGGSVGTPTNAPSENSNSSDFNFLSNLANDFAPEYYQLS